MKVGFVAGAFDLLHAGHIYLLEECKKRCDFLIVGLHVDPSIERKNKNKPVEGVVERQIKLVGCKAVHDVWTYETEKDLSLLMQYLKPDIRFLGSDYAKSSPEHESKITGESLIPIEYIDSLPIHTSELRERVKRA